MARKSRISGWLEQLQGLAEAGPGKVLKIGPLDEARARNRWAQIQSKAKKAGLKVERALSGDFFYVRIVGAPPAPEKADGRDLANLILATLGTARWRTTPQVAGAVLAIDAPAAKVATAKTIQNTLSELNRTGLVLSRDEEGVTSWRGMKDRQ
jgi:hypothetical protein